MQCFGHQVSDLGKGGFHLFSVVILQICLIRLVFSLAVLLACSQDIAFCIRSYVIKGIEGITTVIINTASLFEVPQQLADGLTVMFTARYKTTPYRNDIGCCDDFCITAAATITGIMITGLK